MTEDENNLVVIAWSKVYMALLIADQIEVPGFKETIKFNLETAKNALEELIKENKNGTK